jgi:hypothetical protein
VYLLYFLLFADYKKAGLLPKYASRHLLNQIESTRPFEENRGIMGHFGSTTAKPE